MKIKKMYENNKNMKIGEICICPSCGTKFEKTNKQQVFCRSKKGTVCKDKYWNSVIPTKRNNTTRISPASAMWMEKHIDNRNDFNYSEHPFSDEGLGQWI
jgi:hypothetical protein